MKLCTTTGDFSLHCKTDEEKITEIAHAGFKYIDLSMYGDETRAYMHDNWKEDIKRLKGLADSLGVKFVQAHSPAFETLETLRPEESWEEKFNETIRSIEICKELGIPMTVIHAGVKRNTTWKETLELNKKFYDLLVPTMEKTGVNVLVENVGILDNNGRFYLNSAERLLEFVNYFDHPLLHACWDIGHANRFGAQHDQIKLLGKHLYAIHYNDNDKVKDLHTAPFLNTLDNDDAIRGLIDVGFKGPFTFECTNTIKFALYQFDNSVNGGENRSIDIMRAYEKALFETGKYLLSSYGVYEE